MFFGDHPPPHIHAIYGEYNASISIESLEILEGDRVHPSCVTLSLRERVVEISAPLLLAGEGVGG
jgi:hypothetical protein